MTARRCASRSTGGSVESGLKDKKQFVHLSLVVEDPSEHRQIGRLLSNSIKQQQPSSQQLEETPEQRAGEPKHYPSPRG